MACPTDPLTTVKFRSRRFKIRLPSVGMGLSFISGIGQMLFVLGRRFRIDRSCASIRSAEWPCHEGKVHAMVIRGQLYREKYAP